jgi:hypothetical protein
MQHSGELNTEFARGMNGHAESKGLARICKGSQNFLGGAPMEQEIDFELTAALAIHGRVIDDAKNPVVGAKATATIANPNFRCEQSGRTNADGTFALESLAKGQYFLSVECDGYTMASRAQVEAGGADVEITLQVQGSVTGVVVDEVSGAPVPDFELFVLQSFKGRSPARGKIHQHVHDAGGRFELKNLDPGVFQLQGRAAAFADSLSDEFQVARGQATSGVRIAMNRGGSVAGTVADKSGKLVANAVVSLRTNKMKDNPISSLFGNFADGEQEPKAKTDEKGSFRIDLVVPGTYQVAVRHGEFAGLDQNDVEVRKNEVSTVKLEVTTGRRSTATRTTSRASRSPARRSPRPARRATTCRRARRPGRLHVHGDAARRLHRHRAAVQPGTPMGPFESIVISSNSRVAVSLKDGDDVLVDVRLTRNAAPKKN